MGNDRFTYNDIRDDRIMWFFNLSASQYSRCQMQFAFKVNTVTKGKFYLPPTRAHAMYDNGYRAVIKGREVSVK